MKKTILNIALVAGMLVSASAHADVEAGYYKGRFKDAKGNKNDQVEVFIENTEIDQVPVSYGLILNLSDDQASLFKIEELGDGSQAWIRLTNKSNGLVGSNLNQDAIYNVFPTKSSGMKRLNFTPTSLANTLGCTMEIQTRKKKAKSWDGLPVTAEEFRARQGKQKVLVSNTQINGRYFVGEQLQKGTAGVSEVIPGVGAVRAQSLDSETEDGRAMDRQIKAVITVIGRKIGRDRLQVIKFTNQGCSDAVSTLQK